MILLSHPLVASLLAFLAGLLPALRAAPLPAPLLAAALAASVASLFLSRAAPVARSRRREGLLLFAFLAAGGALGSLAADAAARDCRARLPDLAVLRVQGVLGATSADPGDELPPLLPLAHARLEGGGSVCSASVRVRLPPGTPATRTGSRVVLPHAIIQRPPNAITRFCRNSPPVTPD